MALWRMPMIAAEYRLSRQFHEGYHVPSVSPDDRLLSDSMRQNGNSGVWYVYGRMPRLSFSEIQAS